MLTKLIKPLINFNVLLWLCNMQVKFIMFASNIKESGSVNGQHTSCCRLCKATLQTGAESIRCSKMCFNSDSDVHSQFKRYFTSVLCLKRSQFKLTADDFWITVCIQGYPLVTGIVEKYNKLMSDCLKGWQRPTGSFP